MNKRLLIAISLIVLILVLVGGIFFLVNRSSNNPTPTAPTETPLSGFPVSPPVVNEIPPPPEKTNSNAGSSTPLTPINLIPPPLNISGLTKLAPTPVTGAVLLPRSGSTTPATLIYLEESTGNLFRVATDGQNNQQLTISSLPGIARAWWGTTHSKTNDTLTLLAQSLDNQETARTFHGAYNLRATTTEPTDLVGAVIPDVSAGGIAVSPNRDRFFSLTNTSTGVSGTVTDLFTGKIRTVFTSHLKSWTISWPSTSIIALTPHASAETPGTLYFLNPETGILTRILGDKLGFTALVNQSGTKVLYGQGLSALSVYSIQDGDTRALIIATLPEKCVWASDAVTIYCAVPNSPSLAFQYPDDWWRGEATFNDSFWQVDTSTGEAKIIFTNNSTSGNNQLDAVSLMLDEMGKRLIFTDRWTATLWSLGV